MRLKLNPLIHPSWNCLSSHVIVIVRAVVKLLVLLWIFATWLSTWLFRKVILISKQSCCFIEAWSSFISKMQRRVDLNSFRGETCKVLARYFSLNWWLFKTVWILSTWLPSLRVPCNYLRKEDIWLYCLLRLRRCRKTRMILFKRMEEKYSKFRIYFASSTRRWWLLIHSVMLGCHSDGCISNSRDRPRRRKAVHSLG